MILFFLYTSLSCPLSVSPLSFLFLALSDMNQDSSDEESEEEEDFSRVQFGSRYTAAARCVLSACRVCVVPLTHQGGACGKLIGPAIFTPLCLSIA